MMYIKCSVILLCICHYVLGHRESECTEVGFARSAGSLIHQSFETVKESLLPRWSQEDISGQPPYRGLSPMLKNVTRTGQILEESSKVLLGMIRKTRVGKRCPELWLLRGVEKHVVPLMNLDKDLSEQLGLVMSFRCLMGSPYPNVDGTCVNQESPDLGSIGSKFLRLLTATPGMDGFSLRGSSSSDKVLPSGRSVGNLVRKHLKEPDVTELFKQWGHFIQRDTFDIPVSPLADDVDCCADEGHEDCAPIHLSSDDPEYKNLKCINFIRSARAQAILGHRESMTTISTYLDATPVYGPTNEVAFTRKAGFFGFLKVPEADEKFTQDKKCAFPSSFSDCFPKDETDALIPGLKYLFSLEHNRLAEALAEINPHFDDSLLYNEARRISLAMYNAVTFGEYLPTLVGETLVKEQHLYPGAEGPAANFIPQVNPGVLAGFAVAGYRNPSMVTEWRSEWGLTDLFDSTHYASVKEDKYKDMLAMDVQRTRDQAVPGYIAWRRFCDAGRPLDKWEDLEQIFSKDVVKDLKVLYQDEMGDIDMNVALLEAPEEGAVVGKTFSCIMADQYARLRTGNRLYWEHESAMFTDEQKKEIILTTGARLLCQNLPLVQVPKNAFLPVSEENPLVKCTDISDLDMTHWKDESLIEKMEEAKKEKTQDNKPPGDVEGEQVHAERVMEERKVDPEGVVVKEEEVLAEEVKEGKEEIPERKQTIEYTDGHSEL